MNIRTYMQATRRTRNPKLTKGETLAHAVMGMVSEIGEIASLYQHHFQGEPLSADKLKKEIGDLMWFVMELCDCYKIDPSDILYENIDKLKERYPEGFEEQRSIDRHKDEE